MDASWTCVETCDGWPNGLASFLPSTRKSQKNIFLGRLSAILLANNRFVDVTQLELTCVVWSNGEKVALNLISTKVSASHRKSTQVRASHGQTESQVDPSFQLASTCDSVWPGLKRYQDTAFRGWYLIIFDCIASVDSSYSFLFLFYLTFKYVVT